VRFAAARREYECGFSPKSTIKENLNMLKKMIGSELEENYLSDDNEIIYDETSSYIYDQNVSISSVDMKNGTLLIVY